MDFRTVFDRCVAPEEFDKWRGRYCPACFADVVEYANLDKSKSALEIGPGTGQATEPILKTGCHYLAIELGEHFTRAMKDRFCTFDNFHIVNADFEVHDFGDQRFDLVYSAATIQWIPEQIAFSKSYDLLKPGGALAMMFTQTDYRTPNEDLYTQIQQVYDRYFRPETEYTCDLAYENVTNYGFVDFEKREYPQTRVYTADEFVAYTSIHAPHLTLQEPHKSRFFAGIREAILRFGNAITLRETVVLYLARRQEG